MALEELQTEIAALIEAGKILGAGYETTGTTATGDIMLPDRTLVPFTLFGGTLTIGGGPHDSITAWLNGSAR